MIHYTMLALSVALSAVGQIMFKYGAATPGLLDQYLSWATILGFGCYVIAAVVYTFALRSIPLSVAFPSAAAAYVVVMVVAHFLWQEPLGLQQAIAATFVIGGLTAMHWKV